ncbi:uncharacterized protein LODBEIA_P28410 [Lodderomyces beijingensis]|uniref:Transcription factor CBF/NF-Y/archaeal histone domain-containing protein n=1 Tax=Lodderomyces beijingensis TaxID=1775926 RepID=A0ABP0ZMN4_9ASCO
MVESIPIEIEEDVPATESATHSPAVDVETDEQKQKHANADDNNDNDGGEPELDEEEEAEPDAEEEEQQQQQMSLPLSKIKRIFKMDTEYTGASSSAVYSAGLATELFVQYLVEQASLLAKMDKRKKIQYKDFANAVSSHDALTFLTDTVPRTQPIGELIQKKSINMVDPSKKTRTEQTKAKVAAARAAPEKPQPILPKGQQILNFQSSTPEPRRPAFSDIVSTGDENSDTVMH